MQLLQLFKFFLLFILCFFASSVYAQTTEMSLSVQPSFFINIGGGIYPFSIESYQFGPGGGEHTFGNPAAVNVNFPAGVLTSTIDFFVSFYRKSPLINYRPSPSGRAELIRDTFYDLRAYEGLVQKSSFGGNFSLRFYYSDSDIDGYDEEEIRVYYWSTSSGEWVMISDYVLDQENNYITVSLNHLTLFGVFSRRTVESVVTPTTETVSRGNGGVLQEIKKGDVNNDGKVDIFDFNMLMVNWGDHSHLVLADFNKDYRVDIFDFNILIRHWT